MPTNDERREIAARLRKIGVRLTHEEELAAIYTAFGLNIEEYWLHELLADLIEPEPERTCRMVKPEWAGPKSRTKVCSECGAQFVTWLEKYCPHCGAKVVE